MRIAGQTTQRHYVGSLERNLYNKNLSERRLSSNRKFNRASENPTNAAKALRIRKTMADTADYVSNLESAASIYTAAETSMMNVSDIIHTIYERLIYAANGTQGPTEDEILARNIATYADEMVKLINVVVADRRIFGGVNNDTHAFEITGSSTVTYNGIPVNQYQ